MSTEDDAIIQAARVTFRGKDILLNGQKVGTIMVAEDAEGYFFAWSAFVNGRFGGSAQQNIRHPHWVSVQDAARKWIVAASPTPPGAEP